MICAYFDALFKFHILDKHFILAFSDWNSIELFLHNLTQMIVSKMLTHKQLNMRKKAYHLCSILILMPPLDNIFNDYFISQSEVFHALIRFGNDPSTSVVGLKALISLSLLINYKKYETKNLILSRLSQLCDKKTFNHMASIFMENFWKARMAYELHDKADKLDERQLEKIRNFGISKEKRELMLFFYNCIYSNDNFTKILAFKHHKNNPVFSADSRGSGVKIGTAITEFIGMCHQIFRNPNETLYSKLGVLTFITLLQHDSMRQYLITEEYHLNRCLIDLVCILNTLMIRRWRLLKEILFQSC